MTVERRPEAGKADAPSVEVTVTQVEFKNIFNGLEAGSTIARFLH